MSLTQALTTSLDGLRTAQAGLSIVAANVANQQTPGYVRKTLIQQETATGGQGASVAVAQVSRELDTYLQRQLRTETSGGSYADMRDQFYQRLQEVYGTPGSDSTLETVYSNFTGAVQALSTSPEDSSAKSIVLSSAQALAQQLNSMTNEIQGLRGDTESGLADAVNSANNAMKQIANINQQLAANSANDTTTASLQDQRDSYIDQLSQLMDIRVVPGDANSVNVFTNSGVQLVGSSAAQLSFNAQGTMVPQAQYNTDPAKSNVGTLMLTSPTGQSFDLIASKSIRSGQIAALVDMRDNVLVQAQNQLDGMAASMSKAMSDTTTAGVASPPGPASGFDVDTSGVLAGNTINLTYTDTATQKQHNVTIVRVDDPAALPLANTATTDPNDEVIGVDFSGGIASVVNQLNAKFNGRLQFSAPGGSTLRVVDDGVPNLTDVNSLSVTTTASSLTGGGAQLPFFTDGTDPYTGAITSLGSESVGLAGRIAVNPALLADPSKLVAYSGSTAVGDPTRPSFIYDQLTTSSLSFDPNSGIGSTTAPFNGSMPTYIQQILSQQGQAAANASNLSQGQDVVVSALQQRVSAVSGVSIDQEMTNLLNLQTAYSANARVMSAVKDMIDSLLKT